MLLTIKLVFALLVAMFIAAPMAQADSVLTIYPSIEGSWLNGAIVERSDDDLYFITHQHNDFTRINDSEFRLEVRPIHDLETVKLRMILNELPGVQSMIDHSDGTILIEPIVDLVIVNDSLFILFSLRSQAGQKQSLLFRIDQEGSVVASREFSSNSSDEQLGITPSIELSRYGLAVSYSNGIEIIDDLNLTTVATWEWGTLHNPNSIFQVQSASVFDDEIFFLEFGLKDVDLEQASVEIKKLGLNPAISLDGHIDLSISSNAWNVTKFDLLAIKDRLIVVGIDEMWNWVICEFSRDLAILAPCEELNFSSVAPKNIDAKSFYPHRPNLVGTPKGYIWDMYVMRHWEHSLETTPLIGMRINGSTSVQQLDLPLDEYSSIQGRLAFSRSDAGYFVLVPIGVFFDGRNYISLQLYEMSY